MAGILFNGTTARADATGYLEVGLPFTLCMWLRMDGAGGGSAGRALSVSAAGPTADGIALGCPSSAADRLQLIAAWSGSAGAFSQWTWPFSTGVWRPVSVTYDPTSAANTPAARIDYAAATVTVGKAAAGTYTSGVGGYCIGSNGATATRGWNGGIAHFQFFPNQTLSAALQDKANKYPGSVKVNDGTNMPRWAPLLIGTYARQLVLDITGTPVWASTANLTLTALTTYTANSFKARRRRLLSPETSRPGAIQRVA